jgi:hypothetical protein
VVLDVNIPFEVAHLRCIVIGKDKKTPEKVELKLYVLVIKGLSEGGKYERVGAGSLSAEQVDEAFEDITVW